jgi:hypothetical protein
MIVADEVQTLLFGEKVIAVGITDFLWKDKRRTVLVLTTNMSSLNEGTCITIDCCIGWC